jgi:hypothetical protein
VTVAMTAKFVVTVAGVRHVCMMKMQYRLMAVTPMMRLGLLSWLVTTFSVG